MRVTHLPSALLPLFLLAALPVRVLASDTLQTTGFSNCVDNATITVQTLNLEYNKDTNVVTFDVAGTSDKVQNVTASLAVYAYGKEVYTKDFNPCSTDTYVQEICPVPAGSFSARGSYTIPSAYASYIPAIAYQLPNLDGLAKLQLTSLDGGQELACVSTAVTNGKTAAVAGAQYAAVGVASAALVVSGISVVASLGSMSTVSVAGVGHVGGATSSPTFVEVVGWFQSMAMNGMLSVAYPPVYRSFTQNFGFSTGLVSWSVLQNRIDSFRVATGGNLTHDSVAYLKNSTLVYSSDLTRRHIPSGLARDASLQIRQIVTSVNGTSSTVAGSTNDTSSSIISQIQSENVVSGIRGYVEELSIPQANTFMTVLIMFAIVIAAITAGILLLKVILELWALFGSFPKRLTNFRKQYWWLLAKTITNLILVLYGVWTLYCIYQFTAGDSWAAKALAGVTLGIFTAILLGFTWKIWSKAHENSYQQGGGAGQLYEDKETWRKYSLFYENYKKSYWWLFVPTIIYMFARGCVIAAADGHGLVQTAGQLIVDSVMLILLLWTRPYTLKSGNWINIIIQVVRVLSVCCILIFVEELNISASTKTITGLVLIILQAVMTGLLAILIAVSAIVTCVRANPHRLRRKEAEKLRSSAQDELTPLDAHNSMLLTPFDTKSKPTILTSPRFDMTRSDVVKLHTRGRSKNGYDMVADGREDKQQLPSYAASYQNREESERRGERGQRGGPASFRNQSFDSYAPDYMYRQPQLPDIEYTGRGV